MVSRSRTFCRFQALSELSSKPDDHDGQPGNGHRPQVGAIRDAVHHVFNGDGDLLLHFLRGPARPLRDDPGVIIGDVGIGLDRKMVELQ